MFETIYANMYHQILMPMKGGGAALNDRIAEIGNELNDHKSGR
jgi:hypothetical protein